MKSNKKIQAILCAAMILQMVPTVYAAEDAYLYGTMEIPYAAFYEAEGIEGSADIVASATTSKWSNENLTAGTYHEAAGTGGNILGVVYPVAISKTDLEALGTDNYHFTPLDAVPEAYKEAVLTEGKLSFSAVRGNTETMMGVTAELQTESRYGDYQISVSAINNANGTSDIGTIYGVLLQTTTGERYAMRHLENIWRDEIAWSSGYMTTESHGNKLSYTNYITLPGKTISDIVYITDSGYHTADVSLYVPLKFENVLTVFDAAAASGKTEIFADGFPDDYELQYTITQLDAVVQDGEISFQNAYPGVYTLIAHDASGIYADVQTNFTLTTDRMPAAVGTVGLIKVADALDEDYDNFLNHISVVTVNDTDYAASGKRGVKIIRDDGSIDAAAAAGDTTVFPEDGIYSMTVAATGYTTTLSFAVEVKDGEAAIIKQTVVVEEPMQKPKEDVPAAAAKRPEKEAPATADVVSADVLFLAISSAAAWAVSKKRKQ